MSIKRTKKQKRNANYNYLLYENNLPKKISLEAYVKMEKKKTRKLSTRKNKKQKNSVRTEKYSYVTTLKKDMIKSISVSLFIFTLELVVYWFWK